MKKTYQICKICGETKDISEFAKHSGYKDGYSVNCKSCNNKKYNLESKKAMITRLDDIKTDLELIKENLGI